MTGQLSFGVVEARRRAECSSTGLVKFTAKVVALKTAVFQATSYTVGGIFI